MNYQEFKRTLGPFPVFSVREVKKLIPSFDFRRLVEWQKKKYIQKLRNRFYTFTDIKTDEQFLNYTANKIYSPSYISLETALSYYGFIPEGVFQAFSCTTRKTETFDTPRGAFSYRHLKKELFFGYRMVKWGHVYFAIAEPEKAVIDFLYLNPLIDNVTNAESLRWNKISLKENIDAGRLDTYVQFINSAALSKRVSVIKEVYLAYT